MLHQIYLQMHGRILERDLGHDSREDNKYVDQVDGHHPQEHVESYEVASSDAFGCPGAVVVVLFHAYVAVVAVLGTSFYSDVANFA